MMSKSFVVSAAAVLVVFTVFAFRTAPEIQCGDNGEFLTAAWHLGICHNPGYPVQSLVAHGLCRFLPFGSIGFRGNLASAFWGTAVAAVFLLICRRLEVSLIPALFSCYLFVFSSLFASQATAAEVYTSDVFLVAVNILIFLSWRKNHDSRYRILLFFTLTLGVLIHLSQVLYVPVFLAMVIVPRRHRWKSWVIPACSVALLALSIWIYLPIRSLNGAIPNFRSPGVFEAFWSLVSGAEHRRFQVMSLGWSDTFSRVGEYVDFCLLPALAIPGLVAALAGFAIWIRRFRHWAAVGIWIVLANMIYGVFLNQVSFKATPFGLPALLVSALALASTLDWAGKYLHSYSKVVSGALIAVLIGLTIAMPFRSPAVSDRSGDLAPYRFGRYQQLVLPSGAALLVKGDDDLFIGLYLRTVERFRGDVLWIDTTGEVLPGMIPPADRFASPAAYMMAFQRLERWAAGVSKDQIYYSWDYSERFRPVGVNLFPDRPHPALLSLADELFGSWFASLVPDDSREYQFRRMMSRLWFMQARAFLIENRRSTAEKYLESGLAWGMDISATLRDCGVIYLMDKQYEAAERWLRAAAELNPKDEKIYFFLARLYREQGRDADADQAQHQYETYFRRHFGGY